MSTKANPEQPIEEEEPIVDEDSEQAEECAECCHDEAYGEGEGDKDHENEEEHEGHGHGTNEPEKPKASGIDEGFYEGPEPASATGPDRTVVSIGEDGTAVRAIYINNLKVAEKRTAADGSYEMIAYKYNGDKVESSRSTLYSAGGVKELTLTEKVDDKGQVVAEKQTEWDQTGKLKKAEVEKSYQWENGEQHLTDKIRRRFDDKGMRKSETHGHYENINGADKLMHSETTRFNDRCTKRPVLTKQTTDYKYDEQARLVSSDAKLVDALGKPIAGEHGKYTYDGDSREHATETTIRTNALGLPVSTESRSYTYKEVGGKKVVDTESIERVHGLMSGYEFKDVKYEYDAQGDRTESHSRTYSDKERKLLVRSHDADFVTGTSHNVHIERAENGAILEQTTSDVTIKGEVKSVREQFSAGEKVGEQILNVGTDGSVTLETATFKNGIRKAEKPKVISGDVFRGLGDGSRDKAVAVLADAGKGDLIAGLVNISKLGGKKDEDLPTRFEKAVGHLNDYGAGSAIAGADEFESFGQGDMGKGIDDFIRGGRGDAKKRLNVAAKHSYSAVLQSVFGNFTGALNELKKAADQCPLDAWALYNDGDVDQAHKLAATACNGNKRDFLRGTCDAGFGSGSDGIDMYEAIGDYDVNRGVEQVSQWGDTLPEAILNMQSVGAGTLWRYIETALVYGSKPGEEPSAYRGGQCMLRNGLCQTQDELVQTDAAGALTGDQLLQARRNIGQVLDAVAQAGVKPDGSYDPVVGARNIAEKMGNGDGWLGQTALTEFGRTTNERGEVMFTSSVGVDRATRLGEYTDETGRVVRDSELGFNNHRERGALTTFDEAGNPTVAYDGRRANAAFERLGRNNVGREPLDVGVQTALDMTLQIDPVTGTRTTDARTMQRVFDTAGDRQAIEQRIRDGLLPPGTYDFTARATTSLEMIASPDGKTPGFAADAPQILIGSHQGPYGAFTIGPNSPARSVEGGLLAIQNAGDGQPQHRLVESGITNTANFVPAGETRSFLNGAGYVAGMSDKRDSYDGGVRGTQSFSGTQQFSEGAAIVRDVIGRNGQGQDNLRFGIEQVQTAAAATTGGSVQQLGRVTVAAGGGDGRVGAQAIVNHGEGNYAAGAQQLHKVMAPSDGKLNPTEVGMVATAGNGNLAAGLARLSSANPQGNVRQTLNQLQSMPPAQRETVLASMRVVSQDLGFKPPVPPPVLAVAGSAETAITAKVAAGQPTQIQVTTAALRGADGLPAGTLSAPRAETIGWRTGDSLDAVVPGTDSTTAENAEAARRDAVADTQRLAEAAASERFRTAEAEIRRVEELIEEMIARHTTGGEPVTANGARSGTGQAEAPILKAEESILWREANKQLTMHGNAATIDGAELTAAGSNSYREMECAEAEKDALRRLAYAVLNVAGIIQDPAYKAIGVGTIGIPGLARTSITLAHPIFGALRIPDARFGSGLFSSNSGTSNVHVSHGGGRHSTHFEAFGHKWDGQSFNGRYAGVTDKPLAPGARPNNLLAGGATGLTIKVDGGFTYPVTRRFPVRGGFGDGGATKGATTFSVNARALRGKKKDLALIGPEIALAALFISAGIARARNKDGAAAQADAPASATARAEQLARQTADSAAANQQLTAYKYQPFARPTWLVRTGEDLCKLAEHLFRDARLGWLIADLNVPSTNEMYDGKKRIVELRVRQKIELPVWQDIIEFNERRIEFEVADLVTVVTETAIDAELMQNALAPVIGVATAPAMSMQPSAVSMEPGVVLQPAGMAARTSTQSAHRGGAAGIPLGSFISHASTLVSLPALTKVQLAAKLRGPDDPTAVATASDEVPAPAIKPKFA